MTRFACIALFFACLETIPAAAPPQVDVRLRPAVVLPGQAALLEIEVVKTAIDRLPELPELDGAETNIEGTSQVRRDGEVRLVTYYTVTPTTARDVTIPAFDLPSKGGRLRTRPLRLHVADSSIAGPAPPANRKAHMLLLVPRTEVFAGERIPLQVLILHDPQINLRHVDLPEVPREGFAIDRLENPIRSHVQFAGRRWRSIAYPSRLTALSPGSLTLGPAKVGLTVAVPAEGGGGGIFTRMRQVRLPATSPSLTITAKPLPDGAPEGFNGAVGQFDLEAAFDPPPRHPGEPVAVKVVIEGLGDPAQVPNPTLSSPDGWEVFQDSREVADAGAQSETCRVAVRQVLRREGPSTDTIPPYRLVYFDPEEEAYRILETDPLPLPFPLQGTPDTVAPSLPGLDEGSPGKTRETKPRSWTRRVPGQARWAGQPSWADRLLWATHAVGAATTAGLAFLLLRARWARSPRGLRQAARGALRRKLGSLGGNWQDVRDWLDAWRRSPASRPLSDAEQAGLDHLRRRLDEGLYGPDQPPPPSAESVKEQLAALLR